MGVDGSPSRRAVLLGAGAAGVAGILAACGDGEPERASAGEGPATGPGAATTTAAASEGIPVAEVPVGGGLIDVGRRIVVTQPEEGEFKAFDARCTHEGCLVTSVGAGLINCACHGSQYRIEDGSVARGPSTAPLPERSVTVSGDTVLIR